MAVRLAAAVAVGLVAVACDSDRVLVRASDGADFGRKAVMEAVSEFADGARTVADYRAMAARLEALEPDFDDFVAELAERKLVFLALGPLERHVDETPEAQYEALALTVWPTALGIPPEDGETPEGYAARLCAGPLALDCRHIVPEYRPAALNAMAWRRLKNRARKIASQCRPCADEPEYQEALERYDRHESIASIASQRVKVAADPRRWPAADRHAQPWSAPPLLRVTPLGEAELDGIPLSPGAWREGLRYHRDGAEVLGVYLEPTQKVRVLRAVVQDAAAAGFREIALQVREQTDPYPLREYRIATRTRGRGQRVRIRDIDTIQSLVRTLDLALATSTSPRPLLLL
jgi:hypothetical protein